MSKIAVFSYAGKIRGKEHGNVITFSEDALAYLQQEISRWTELGLSLESVDSQTLHLSGNDTDLTVSLAIEQPPKADLVTSVMSLFYQGEDGCIYEVQRDTAKPYINIFVHHDDDQTVNSEDPVYPDDELVPDVHAKSDLFLIQFSRMENMNLKPIKTMVSNFYQVSSDAPLMEIIRDTKRDRILVFAYDRDESSSKMRLVTIHHPEDIDDNAIIAVEQKEL